MSKKIEFDMGTMVATSFDKFAKPSKADKKKAKTATATAKQKAAKAKTAAKAKEVKKKALPQRRLNSQHSRGIRDEYKDKRFLLADKPFKNLQEVSDISTITPTRPGHSVSRIEPEEADTSSAVAINPATDPGLQNLRYTARPTSGPEYEARIKRLMGD